MTTLTSFVVALLGFVVLDGLWLGVLMGGFYRDRLAHLARMEAGAMAPLWPAAALVYVLLAAGIVGLVLPRAGTTAAAAASGALLGLVVYGVYDLTNQATLRQWPVTLTIVDIAWGTSACAAVAAITMGIRRWWP